MKTDPGKTQAVIRALEKTEKGKIMYPGTLRKDCGMSIKEVYETLHALSGKVPLDEVLELWCPQCENTMGIIYKTISEVPDEIACPRCGGRIRVPLEHALVVYRKG